MSGSREDSPDWLRAFKAPTNSTLSLPSDSDYSQNDSPKEEDNVDSDKLPLRKFIEVSSKSRSQDLAVKEIGAHSAEKILNEESPKQILEVEDSGFSKSRKSNYLKKSEGDQKLGKVRDKVSAKKQGSETAQAIVVVSGPQIMVGFKNRYMVMEVFLDPNRELGVDDPIILTQFNVSKAIRDSILVNFGECGLASSLGSFQVKYVNPITKLCIIRASREEHQKVWAAITLVTSVGNCPVLFNLLDLSGSIKACKKAAFKCDELKFEQYKLVSGSRHSPEVIQQMHNCQEKIKILDH